MDGSDKTFVPPVQPSSPLVVLDSGLGGLTVVRAMRRLLPAEVILYFGDTARLPYGAKTAATVTGFVRQIIDYLLVYQPKHVVIACNTATALCLDVMRSEFRGLSISGVIKPGARAAVASVSGRSTPRIGVIGTEATVRSGAYEQAIARRCRWARVVARSTPLLAPMVEEGRQPSDPLVQLALEQYLAPVRAGGLDALVLGCTHYPVYRQLIQHMLGAATAVIDSAGQCAQDVRRRLLRRGLLRCGGRGSLQCFVTDDPARFARLAYCFLGMTVPPPRCVPPDELPQPAVAVRVGRRSVLEQTGLQCQTIAAG